MRFLEVPLLLFFATTTAQAGAPNGAFRLEGSGALITDLNSQQIQNFLNEATRLLPPSVTRAIGRTVHVHFENLSPAGQAFIAPPCSADSESGPEGSKLQNRGFVRKNDIVLNAAMIPELLRSESSTTYGCGHRTLYRLALATLIHEVGHLYDFLNLDTADRRARLALCEQEIEEPKIRQCQMRILNPPRVISDSPAFHSLMNWDYHSSRNTQRTRSPDLYEFSKIEEAFAVNFEYFIVDPDFACRRPAIYDFYRERLAFEAHPERSCQVNTVVPLSSQTEEKGIKLVDLDPARVYRIDYLFASSGPQLMSKFGHAMFRIVTCAPQRKQANAACLNDVSEHVVVSFRARPGESGIDPWKGLTGAYPSLMYLFSFYPQIINEYTLDEPRDLVSLPLQFTETQKRRFLMNVLETHWSYQGDYYFLGNNCATEAINLLKRVIWDPAFQERKVTTPIGLYDDLALLGLTDGTLVEPREKGIKHGYLFPSNHDVFEKTFVRLRAVNPALVPWDSFKSFVDESDAEERLKVFEALRQAAPAEAKNLANRFLILESYVFRLMRRAAMDQISEEVQSSKDPVIAEKVKTLLRLQGQANPFEAPSSGYGVPLTTDRNLDSTTPNPESPLKDQIVNELLEAARARHPDLSNELTAMARNRKYFLREAASNP